MNRLSILTKVAAMVLCLLGTVELAIAQEITATISGTVKDEGQAVIPGVTITVTNTDTEISRSVVTDDRGRYRAANLAVGRYQVSAELTGFKKETRSGMTLTVGREAVVDLTLTLGNIVEEVLVRGEAPLVEASRSEISGLVDVKTIADLPLNGRDLQQLMVLQPGVSVNRASNKGIHSGGSGARISVGGTRETQTLFLLDGTMLNDAMGRSPGGEAGVFMGAEAVQEFKVILHNMSAEYGRAAGGVFNAITKSGTNAFHGSGFEFHRDSAFDAKNFFDTGAEPPPFKRDQFGGSLGGPIVRNKTFFFATYESLRDRKTGTVVLNVPTQAGRQGILGSTVVPVNPAVVPYLALYPLPNGRDFGDGRGEYITETFVPTNEDYVSGRVDYQLAQNDSLFGRVTYDNSTRLEPTPNRIPTFPQHTQSKRLYLTVQETKILSANLLNVFRFGYTRSNANSVPAPLNPYNELAFVPGMPVGEIIVTGLSDNGIRRQDPRIFIQDGLEFSDTLSWEAGAHSLKFGVNLTSLYLDHTDAGIIRGTYQFTSLANLLRAIPSRFSVSGVDSREQPRRFFRQKLFGVFVQDDYKIRPNLTLNLGLRYEFVTTPHEVDGQWSRLLTLDDRATTVDNRPWTKNPTLKNFAPRVGFAWTTGGSGKTSVRGGVGMYYDPPLSYAWREPINNPPFRGEYALLAPARQAVFPNAFQAQSDLLVGALARSGIFFIEPEPSAAYVAQYGLTIQREVLPNTVVSVGYSGHRGFNLLSESDFNLGSPTILPSGQKFFPAGTVPRNASFASMRYKQFNAKSWHDALLLQLTKRFGDGLQFQLAYTFSKTLDTASLVQRGDGDARRQRTQQDPYNPDLDKGRSDFDVPHNLVINGSYELPFWRGKLYGGWQISGVFTAVSGTTFNPKVGFDVDRDGTILNDTRPNLVPDVPLYTGTVDQWFNPAAFALQPRGFYGDAGRNILRSPSVRTVDLALMKNTAFTARPINIQFRAEVFNVLNRANFGLPRTTVFASSGAVAGAGRLTDTVTSARQVQLGIKVTF